MAPENANDVVSSSGSHCGDPCVHDPSTTPGVSPNCFDKDACFFFYLMHGFSGLVINAGLSEAAALIVFKTTYLSYECFIQETKYEPAG